jgi:hypothetical protein
MNAARQQMQEISRRRDALTERIVKTTRPVIAVLKDSGHFASAAPLEELFFELDALDQEMMTFTMANMDEILRSLTEP